jgi:aryl-alcohol dehydrogenase-like predicted oxidoreductase
MKFRKFGNTGIEVSEIGLGTAQLGGPSLINGKYLGYPGIPKETSISILEKAFDSHINFFDSSDKYGDGEAERLLGEAFKKKRDRVIIATKCGITANGTNCFDKDYITSCLHQSLINLKTDYIDVFQLTKPPLEIIEKSEIYDILDQFKKEGKIRFSGISTGSDDETIKLIDDRRVDSLQIFYNLLHISPEKLFIKKAFDSGIGLIIRSPLSSGALCGKYTHETKFDKGDDRSSYLHGETLRKRVDIVTDIIKTYDLGKNQSIINFSLNYLLSNPYISTIIPGVSKVNQLDEILKLLQTDRMNAEESNRVVQFIMARQ